MKVSYLGAQGGRRHNGMARMSQMVPRMVDLMTQRQVQYFQHELPGVYYVFSMSGRISASVLS